MKIPDALSPACHQLWGPWATQLSRTLTGGLPEVISAPMKAIAINGSPRKGGNTETLLRKVLEPLTKTGWDTEFIQLGGKEIRGCRACYQCFKKKNSRCGQKADAFDPCLEKMIEADAIILGSRSEER